MSTISVVYSVVCSRFSIAGPFSVELCKGQWHYDSFMEASLSVYFEIKVFCRMDKVILVFLFKEVKTIKPLDCIDHFIQYFSEYSIR